MDKKQVGYCLIVFGLLDFVLGNLGILDMTYWLIGDLATFSPVICGFLGYYLINQADTETQTKIDDIDIEEGESIIHRIQKSSYVFTLTNKKIRYLSAYMENQRDHIDNLPESSNSEYLLEQIDSIKSVKSKEVAANAITKFVGGIFNNDYGVQIVTKEGAIVNLAVTEANLVVKYVTKQLEINNNKIKN